MFKYRKLINHIYLLLFSLTFTGCSSPLFVPDSQLMREPLPSTYEFNIPVDKLWHSTNQVLKANGWKIKASSENMGLLSLYRQKSMITLWMSAVIRPSQKGSTLRFHSIYTMRPKGSENPEMGKATVFVSLESWEPLVEQISNASDGSVVDTW